MATIVGREVVIGAKKASAWGTPVAAGALDGVLSRACTLGQDIEELVDENLGQPWSTDTQSGREDDAGELRAWMRYEGLETLIALAMGTAGVPTSLGDGAYLHTLVPAASINGLFATFARKMKSDTVFEHPSVKVAGFQMKGGFRTPMEVTFQLIASGMNVNAGSGVNNNTTIGNITYRTLKNRVLIEENGYVRMNDKSGAVLGASDDLYASEWTLTMRRPMEGDHLIDGFNYITEPLQTDFAEVMLELAFPQFDDVHAALWAKYQAKTAQKIELFTRGELIGATERYRMLIQIPAAYISTMSANPDGPGKIATPMRLRLTKTDTAPSGMTGITDPFIIKLVNARNTDSLA